MKSLSIIVIFISMISFGYAFETIEKSMNVFELEIVDFEEIGNLEDLDYLDSHHSSCKNINMTKEQKRSIMMNMINLKKSKIDHKAEMKKGKIDYMVSLFKPGSKRETSYAIGNRALNHASAMKKEAFEFIHKTLFTTLQPDQRKNLVKCLMKMKRAKKANRRHKDHHGVIEK
ncbi:hypothetical protein OAK75_11995 [Bacteriovoracales bacterium]|nr:hypothetical protein [Bacteriovoracales bacterium]